MAGPSGPLFDHMLVENDHGRAREEILGSPLCKPHRESERSYRMTGLAKAPSARVERLNQGQRAPKNLAPVV